MPSVVNFRIFCIFVSEPDSRFLIKYLTDMQKLFRDVSFGTSKLITESYSTSFSGAVNYLHPEIRFSIYSIYGFVRLADEIVDSFHEYDRKLLLEELEKDYYASIKAGISLNPILNSFQETVRKYNIDESLVAAFLESMKTDLVKSDHISSAEENRYIYGSAEVVGLMCLKVFVKGDNQLYDELMEPAKKLGAAFQKVNFLRDIKNDTELLKRRYFHLTVGKEYTDDIRKLIIDDILNDFDAVMPGIKKLPPEAKTGVLIAYYYYKALLGKISRIPAKQQFLKRIRIPDPVKYMILGKAMLVSRLNLI